MKRAELTARDRALLEEVRVLLLALRADVSLELEDRLAKLEHLVKQVPRMTRRALLKPKPKGSP